MNADEFSRSAFPPGGWIFIQPQTGWQAPTPTSSTFRQTVDLIYKHRAANPAICKKHGLSLNREVIGNELETFTRTRLGIPLLPKHRPLRSVAQSVGAAVVAAGSTMAQNMIRAAQGTAVVIDWLRSGGAPVEQALADKRAEICVGCPYNEEGNWYTTAPAEIIKETLEQRKELTLATPFDDRLKSCHVCRCLNRLKVWVPISHIQKQTKPEVMAEFPSHCWIRKGE